MIYGADNSPQRQDVKLDERDFLNNNNDIYSLGSKKMVHNIEKIFYNNWSGGLITNSLKLRN